MARSPSIAWDPVDAKAAPALFRKALGMAARGWRRGTLSFTLPSGHELTIGGGEPGPDGRIIIHDYRFVRRALAGGDIGFAEGYMANEWETPDLSAVLEGFSLNYDDVQKLAGGGLLNQMLNLVGKFLRRNTRDGSKKNIHAHYDLGNAFYSQWLDPTMTYSSARYERPGQSLPDAQRAKYAALAETIALRPGQSVLEIGCGWGGFAEFAAKEVGAQVTGVTISKEQYDFAKKRMFDHGLADKADIRLIDYRDVEGQFDRVASIEMFEAVGEQYWPTYFNKVRDVLAPGGRAGLQIITIRDELFDHYRSRPDFIQKYVFPGGMLPSEARLRQETDRAGLEWRDISRFGQSYAETLVEWARSFESAWGDIKRMGFDERFRRLWRFYLSYCEAGFRTGRTDVIQLGLSKA